MLNSRWHLEFAFFLIISKTCIFPNLVLSAYYVDSRWPLEFAFVLILSGVFISHNPNFERRLW